MRWIEYLIYFFLFIIPWQTRLILRHGIINGGNWEYGIIGIYGTEILLWIIILLSLLRSCGKLSLRSRAHPFLFCTCLPAGRVAAPPAGGESAAKKRNGCARYPIYCLLPFLFIILIVSILSASNRLIAIQQSIHIIEAVAVYILLTKFPIDRLKAAYAFLAGLALQVILGIYQFLTQSTFTSKWLGLTLHDATVGGASVLENLDGRWLRAYAGLPHSNIFGGYMAVGIFIIVVLLSRHLIEKKARIFLLAVNCLLLTGLFFSFSRSAWIGLIVGLVFFWFFNCRRLVLRENFKLFFLSSVVLITALSLLYTPLLKNRISGEGRLETRAVEERIGGYSEVWQLFKKQPFFGVGLGNYTLAVRDEIDSSRPAWFYQPAHNVFLLMLAELGVVGLLIILLICYLAGFKISRNLLPFCALFFLLAIFDHYLWSLYSGLILVSVGGGVLARLTFES